MSAFRGQLRSLAQSALLAAGTLAGNNVFLPRDWPLNSTKMPAILLQTPTERKESRGKSGIPQFEAVTWLQVKCQLDGDDPGTVESNIETLADQVELALLGLAVGPPQIIDQIAAIETEMSLTAEGKRHIGEAILRFAVQYPEDYVPTAPDRLAEVDITLGHDAVAGDAVGELLETTGESIKVPLPGPDN